MTIQDLGSLGELIAAVATLITLVYLAIQIRQNTAQQRREELVSIQHGQNSVLAAFGDADLAEAYIRTSKGRDATPSQRFRAQTWVLRYINHFQIVRDFYEAGNLDEEQYRLWEGFAVSVIAPDGIRHWWDEENGKTAFHSNVRDLIDARLQDEENPPFAVTEVWSSWNYDVWEAEAKRGSDT